MPPSGLPGGGFVLQSDLHCCETGNPEGKEDGVTADEGLSTN